MATSDNGSSAQDYAIRLSESAIRDRAEAIAWLSEIEGEIYAREWLDSLKVAMSLLAHYPHRNAVQVRESRLLKHEVRREIYRKSAGGTAYIIFYEIREAPTTEGDGPTVRILHIRHGSRGPMTAKEARNLRGGF